MMKKYKKPEISAMAIDSEDIILTSDEGNLLMSGSFNSASGAVGTATFNNQWISGSFSDQ